MSAKVVSNIRLAVLFGLISLSLAGFGCRSTPGGIESNADTITVWGLWQDSEMMDPVVKGFQDTYGVKVDYKKIASVATYEKTLLEALAQGRGPDVFVIHHTWVESKRGLLSPAPNDIVDVKAVRDEFVDVVEKDVVRDNFVYALPTSVDTLALYYNRDLLAAAGVARPPATWQDFQQAVEKITKISRLGTIEQSAVALGTAANVNRASDILQLLMMQSGLSIIDQKTNDIDIANEVGNRSLVFYTDFSNKSKKVYSWNLQKDFSIDSFAEGDTAMMINYSYHIPTIEAKNPRLNFGISTLPQIADSKSVTFASYWPFAVSTTSRVPKTSWQFVRYMTNAVNSKIINDAQRVPPARRDAIEVAGRDPLLGVFATQALTAVTWPRVDIVATDAIFNAMIDDVVTGSASIGEALQRGRDQLKQLMQQDETTALSN